MTQRNHKGSASGGGQPMLDEIEQLRTALESALEENARLADDRDRLLTRVSALSRELQHVHAMRFREAEPAAPPPPAIPSPEDEQEEKLRVAFEELQVLTEELEVANNTLQETNDELDVKVEERTTELKAANATLRVAEKSFRAITDLVPDLLWRASADGEANWFNGRWLEYTGQGEWGDSGASWIEAVHPLDRPAVESVWKDALRRGDTFESEHRIRDARGGYRWFLVRAQAMRDEAGRVEVWYAAGTDIDDHRMAMSALQQSELRFRTLIEGMPQLVWRAVDGGKWTWSSPQWTAFTGQSEPASHASGWLDMLHPDDRRCATEAWEKAETVGRLEFEARLSHAADGRYRHFHTRAMPVRDEEGQTAEWLGTSTDIDDIIQLQSRQSVLVGELQHRTRNLLAVIHALVKRTIKDSSSMNAFRECFENRLMALARVQGLLSRREVGARVSFDRLIRGELSAHISLDPSGNGERVSTEGPEGVPLKSATVQTLALALHELTTNAIKYGALAQPDGRLDVRWQVVEADTGGERLRVDWRESGVTDIPDDRAPARGGGYGRELIEKALPHQLGAATSFAFETDGVHCTIEVDIPSADSIQERSHG